MSTERRPNIVLTGLTAVGKSAVAKRIASISEREFVDLGAELVARYGNVYDLSDDKRTEAERQVVAEFAPKRNLAIATTSTTMLDDDNIVSLLGAETYHLTASTVEIAERARTNGLAMHPEIADAEELEATIDAMRSERAERYERFTTVDTTGKSVEKVVNALRDAGADITDPMAITDDDAVTPGMDSRTQTMFMYIIAAALAVLVVLVVLVLSF